MNKPQTPESLCEAIRTAQILSDDMETVEECCSKADSVTRAAKTLMKAGLLTGWQANQLLQGATALRLGNVVLLDELTPWEAGRTFIGRDPKGRLLRIKLIPGQMEPAIWDKLKATAAKRDIRIAGCETFRGAHQVGDRQVLISQTQSGLDLKTYAEQNELTLPQATQLLKQIGQALQDLHDKKGYHGLLMLEKVHVTEDQEIKLLDIELAVILPFLDVSGPNPRAEKRRQQAIEAAEEFGARRADWSMLGQLGIDLIQPLQDSDEKKRILKVCSKLRDTADCDAEQWANQIAKATPELTGFSLNLDPDRDAGRGRRHRAGSENAGSENAGSEKGDSEKGDSRGDAGASDVAEPSPSAQRRKRKTEKAKASQPDDTPGGKARGAKKSKRRAAARESNPSKDRQQDDGHEEQRREPSRKAERGGASKRSPSSKTDEDQPTNAPSANRQRKRKPKEQDAESRDRRDKRDKGNETERGSRKTARRQDRAAADEPTGSRKRLLLIVAVCLALVAVGGGIFGATQWLGSSDDKQTAEQDSSAAEESDEADETESDPEFDPETDPSFDPETDPELGLPNDQGSAASGEGAIGTDENETGDDSAATPPNPAEGPRPGDGETSTDATPTADGDNKPADPQPEDPKSQPPKPEDPKPEDPKPEDPKPAAKPPKPAPRPPFRQLLAAVALATPEEAPTVKQSFGKIHVDDPNTLFASLRGGGTAIRGRERFVMQSADNGTAVGKWEFNWIDREDQPTTVATLELQGNDLLFQWQPAAQENRSAGQLINCAISFSSGMFSHVVALREPQVIDPPKVNLERGVANGDWELPLPPDPDAVFVEISGVSGPLGGQKIIPEQPLNVSSQGQWILAGTPQKPIMAILAQWSLKRGLELDLSTHVYPDGGRPDYRSASKSKLNSKTLQSAMQAKQRQVNAAQGKLATYSPAARNRVPKQFQAVFDEERKAVEAAYGQLQSQLVAMQELATLGPQIHDTSVLEFRVYHNADQTQVELLRTTGFKAPKPQK